MAYNNIFPMGYQPTYYPQQQQQNNNMIWVQGEAGAKSYLVAPNTTVQLWDSEAQVIYLKSADASGMPNIKVLDYTIRNSDSQAQPPVLQNNVSFATKEDLETLAEEVASMQKRLDGLSTRTKKKEGNSDE